MLEQNKPKRNKWNPTGAELRIKLAELKVKSEQNKIKLYKPEDIRTFVSTIVFVACIITGLYVIFTGYFYWKAPFKEYIIFSLFAAYGIYFLSKLLYYNYAYCIYVETTEEDVRGKNSYKMKRGVIKFNEIKEIWIDKGYIVLHLKDIHDNRLGINFSGEMVPLLKEILEKSENCTRIDCIYDYLMKYKRYMKLEQLPEIKPILDKRLAEIKEKNNG